MARGNLRSLYELQRTAGLEPGGIRPVLRRLEKEELLVRSREAKRRRRLIEATDKGQQVLEQHWAGCMQLYPDAESVLRAAGLAVLMDQSRFASTYLTDTAKEYERRAGIQKPQSLSSSPLHWYASMRALWQTRKHQAAANVFRDIAKELAISQAHQ